jgi:hypothetical protein
MLKRFKMGAGAVLGVAALALGGSAIAAATSGTPAKSAAKAAAEPKATGADTDNIQSGDQTTPDSTTKAANAGETNVSETSTSETSGESTSESSTPSDGPGGHADPAGNVNNQQQGQN